VKTVAVGIEAVTLACDSGADGREDVLARDAIGEDVTHRVGSWSNFATVAKDKINVGTAVVWRGIVRQVENNFDFAKVWITVESNKAGERVPGAVPPAATVFLESSNVGNNWMLLCSQAGAGK
jgi:hypothetical protein